MSFDPALILAPVLAAWPVLDITENPKSGNSLRPTPRGHRLR
jgi:hypothetical protein